MAEFSVSLAADLSRYIADLSKAEKYTEAQVRSMAKTRVLSEQRANDQIRVLREKAALGLAKADQKGMKESAKSLKDLSDEAGDADSILKGLGGALGEVDGQADKMAGTMGEAFAGLEAVLRVGGKLGPVGAAAAAAIAAVGVAFAINAQDIERSTRRMEEAATLMEAQAETSRAVEDARIALKLATGELTEREAALHKIQRQVTDTYDSQRAAILEQIKATEADIEAKDKLYRKILDALPAMRIYNWLIGRDVETHEELEQRLVNQRKALDGLTVQQEAYAEVLKETDEATRNEAKSKRAHAEATRAQAEAERARLQLIQEQEQAMKSLRDGVAALEQDNARAADADRARLDERLAQLAELEAGLEQYGMLEASSAEAIATARANAERTYQDARARIAQEIADQRAREAEAELREAEQVAAEKARLDAHYQAGRVKVGDDALALIEDQLLRETERREEEGTKSARTTFRLAQATGIARAGVSAALAALAAIEPPPVGYGPTPLGFGVAGVAAAAGAGAIATIASQPAPAHRGMLADEVPILAQRGEAVMSRSAVDRVGPQTIQALNEGRTPAMDTAPRSAVLRIGARTMGEVQIASMSNPAVRRAVRGGRRVGQRARV